MNQVGVWRIGERGPERVQPAAIDFEEQLESWIESDPSLVETGLRIVGRQVQTEGGVVDLLAVDPQGRWVVIEIKRDRLYRGTLAQAHDYASCIATMSAEELRDKVRDYLGKPGKEEGETVEELLEEDEEGERELRVCVVGLSRDPSLDRVAGFLAGRYGVAIKAVTFEAYELGSGERVLVRELSEVETPVTGPRRWTARSVEEVLADVEVNGIGPEFRKLTDAARRHSLYLRPWKRSLMITPRANRSRMLYTIETRPTRAGELRGWLAPEAFAEFFRPLTEEEVTRELGRSKRLTLSTDGVDRFVEGLDLLFARVRSSVEGSEEAGEEDGGEQVA